MFCVIVVLRNAVFFFFLFVEKNFIHSLYLFQTDVNRLTVAQAISFCQQNLSKPPTVVSICLVVVRCMHLYVTAFEILYVFPCSFLCWFNLQTHHMSHFFFLEWELLLIICNSFVIWKGAENHYLSHFVILKIIIYHILLFGKSLFVTFCYC